MNTYKRRKYRKPKPKSRPIDPEQLALLEELVELLQKCGLPVRMESGNFSGGFCRVQDQNVFFINKSQNPDFNIELLKEQLTAMDLDGVYISPKIRDFLEENITNEGS
ncbi:MAG: hypothetical protein WAN36_06690 [Calditrichia bacterium]